MTLREMFKGLRYGAQILQLFESQFEDWMDENDRDCLVRAQLSALGVTLAQLDEQIHVGVGNGFPAELQVQLCIAAIGMKDRADDFR